MRLDEIGGKGTRLTITVVVNDDTGLPLDDLANKIREKISPKFNVSVDSNEIIVQREEKGIHSTIYLVHRNEDARVAIRKVMEENGLDSYEIDSRFNQIRMDKK